MNLGVLYTTIGEMAKAQSSYMKALTLNDRSPELHYNLGNFFEFHGVDLGKAAEHYRQYLELGGKDQRITRLLEQLSSP